MSQASRQRSLFVSEDWRVVYRAFTEVNFTAYDFDTLRSAMVDYIRINFPEDFNDWIESSEFVAIIELLAYLGQSLAFRTDLNTRENFLDTAERRESILKLSRMLSFNASRNRAATGLVKITQLSTTQSIIDSNGTNLANRTIRWNDANNPDWFEQFILILNSVFISTTPFGKPTKDGLIGDVKTQLYTLNNEASANKTFPFSSVVNNETLGFEIVNPDFTNGEFFFEKEPNPEESLGVIFRNDGQGNGSSNTGFFMLFKQGSLKKEDFKIDVPVENRVIEIDGTNINNTDVFVQEIDEDGFIIKQWTKVPTVTGSNIIFNSLSNNERDIFSVVTRPNDQISIRFADGRFGNVPTGIFRVWYRESSGTRYTIKPENIRNNRLDIPYFNGVNNDINFVSMFFALQESVSNSSPAQSSNEIKQVAPAVYYTQDRMVNGEDYNVFPLRNADAARVKSVNRIHSGFSRHVDINDPTGKSQNVSLFAEDGLLYQEENNELNELALVNGVSDLTNDDIILKVIAPMIDSQSNKHFFYYNYPRFTPTFSALSNTRAGVTGVDINGANSYTLNDSIVINGIDIILSTGSAGDDINNVIIDINAAIIANPIELDGLMATADGNSLRLEQVGKDLILEAGTGNALLNLGFIEGIYTQRSYGTYWRNATNAINSSTGRFFVDVDDIGPSPETTLIIGENASTIPEFHMGEGSIIKFKNAGWVSVVSIINDGVTILSNGDGSVRLSEPVEDNDYVEEIIVPFRINFTEAEQLTIDAQLSQKNTFGIRYDIGTEEWKIITGDNLANSSTPFSFENAGSDTGTPIDSSWLIRAEFSSTNWRFIARGLDYVFESDEQVRFYHSSNSTIVDPTTGRSINDFINILKINTEFDTTYSATVTGTGTTYNSGESIIINSSTILLSTGTTISEAKAIIDASGINGLEIDITSGFMVLVYNGSIPLTLQEGNGTALNDLGFVEGVYSDDIKFVESNALGLGIDYKWTINGIFKESDGYEDPKRLKLTFTDTDEDGIPDDPTLFENITGLTNNGIDGNPITNSLASALPDTGYADKSELFWVAFDNADGFQEFTPTEIQIVKNIEPASNDLLSTFTNLGGGDNDVIYFRDTGNFYSKEPLNNVNLIDVTDSYYTRRGRNDLYFHWKHFAPINSRIDPAITNIIDMYILTITYDTQIRQWIDNNGSIADKPKPPTNEELKFAFAEELQNKMISDEIVWHPVRYKILFGNQADESLRARFKVTKVEGTEVSDGEIKSTVVATINEFFAINNFDFGETFYFTELAAFIHQRLATVIGSIIIVPLDDEQHFGDLFQVRSAPDEVFISAAKVSDVQIITSFNDNVLRIGN